MVFEIEPLRFDPNLYALNLDFGRLLMDAHHALLDGLRVWRLAVVSSLAGLELSENWSDTLIRDGVCGWQSSRSKQGDYLQAIGAVWVTRNDNDIAESTLQLISMLK